MGASRLRPLASALRIQAVAGIASKAQGKGHTTSRPTHVFTHRLRTTKAHAVSASHDHLVRRRPNLISPHECALSRDASSPLPCLIMARRRHYVAGHAASRDAMGAPGQRPSPALFPQQPRGAPDAAPLPSARSCMRAPPSGARSNSSPHARWSNDESQARRG